MSLDAAIALQQGPLDLAVDLTVAGGEVVAVLGPNGAGKTTLLRALAGLVPLAGGHVRLGKRTLEDVATGVRLPPEQRRVGMVFQDHLLFPHLSARDNVAFGLRATGSSRRTANRTADAWLARMRLADHAGARPDALSGGQAQRVALARALAGDPGLLLLDEPLAALDVDTRLAVRRQLADHLDAFGGPCLVVTHEPLEAIALADRIAVLEHGHIVQVGSVEEVARRPRSDWAARLVGLNLYRGRADGTTIHLERGGVLTTAVRQRGAVFVTVQPRAVALYRSPPAGSPRNVWQGRVDGLDVHGDHVRVHVDGPITIAAEVTPAAVAELRLASDAPVWVAVKATEIEVYPA